MINQIRKSDSTKKCLGLLATVFTVAAFASMAPVAKADRPNISWITIEDWSPDLSCYGTKPPIELFDLQKDPHEVHSVADDPAYADVRRVLIRELESWRTDVIHDQGVSEDFKAIGEFPETCPTETVDEWVESNTANYDFETSGWPGWYPTRTLDAWTLAVDQRTPYVFRNPGDDSTNIKTPSLPGVMQ